MAENQGVKGLPDLKINLDDAFGKNNSFKEFARRHFDEVGIPHGEIRRKAEAELVEALAAAEKDGLQTKGYAAKRNLDHQIQELLEKHKDPEYLKNFKKPDAGIQLIKLDKAILFKTTDIIIQH